jgi:hypothetical protein
MSLVFVDDPFAECVGNENEGRLRLGSVKEGAGVINGDGDGDGVGVEAGPLAKACELAAAVLSGIVPPADEQKPEIVAQVDPSGQPRPSLSEKKARDSFSG